MNTGSVFCGGAGILFFLLGALFWILKGKAAILISGFNTIPKQQRRQYDTERMSRDQRNTFFIWAAIMAAGFLLSYFISKYFAILAGIVWLIFFFKDVHLDEEKAFGKYKLFTFFALSAFLFSTLGVTIYANSSWQWISETRPYDVLPWTAAVTVLIEVVCINFIGGIHKIYKVSAIVIVANAFSFAAPYLFSLFDPVYDFYQMLDSTPLYIVGPAYLLVTIIAEAPIVYTFLKKDAPNTKKLLKTVFFCNIATTAMTAVIEHIFCRGIW